MTIRQNNHTAFTYENKVKAAWFLTTLQQLLQSFNGWLLFDVNLQRIAESARGKDTYVHE